MDTTAIRTSNMKEILSLLRFSEGLTKRELAQKTGLSFSTVSNLCNDLKEQHVFTEGQVDSTSVGRTPNLITFRYDHFITLCISLEMEHVMDLAVLNLRNQVLFRHRYDISRLNSSQEIIEYAGTLLQEFNQFPWIQERTLIGVGIAIDGYLNPKDSCVYHSAIPLFQGAPLLSQAEKTFSIPCQVETQARLHVLSLQVEQPNLQHLIYLDLSLSIGLGVVSHGNLIQGNYGFATELAHLPLGKHKHLCPSCGHMGCIDTELSLAGFLGEYSADTSTLLNRWQEFLQDAKENKKDVGDVIKEKGHLLGEVIGVLLSIFDPSILCIGGIIAQAKEFLSPYVEEITALNHWASRPDTAILWDLESETSLFRGINQKVVECWIPFDTPQG